MVPASGRAGLGLVVSELGSAVVCYVGWSFWGPMEFGVDSYTVSARKSTYCPSLKSLLWHVPR